MKAKWLFEKDVFDTTEEMMEIVKKLGMDAKVAPYVPFDDEIVERCNEMYTKEDCVVFYGSLNFGKKLQKTGWVPGVYLNEKAFECTAYYPAIGDILIHFHDFIMLPYGVLIEKKDELFSMMGQSHLFIRPNSGTKEFTGFIATQDNFDEAVELAGFYDVEPDLLVLVSGAWDLKKEWRFVVVDGKVVSGSLYRDWTIHSDDYHSQDYVRSHSKSTHEGCKDDKAWEIAQQCADKYNPDRAWTIDVCQTLADNYKILEIGCFSCAGMYANDLEKVITAVSEAAVDEWREIFDEKYEYTR